MRSMTYGTLPTRTAFDRQFRSVVGDDDFQMHLKGHDDECAEEWGHKYYASGNYYYDADELWRLVDALTFAYNYEGVGCAGDLASSILSVLGFEWV